MSGFVLLQHLLEAGQLFLFCYPRLLLKVS